ncbi:hypothetical protein AKJ16_DCAP05225 [Drosera capensis]
MFGCGFSHQPPLPALRQTALAAAQKRQNLGALLPSGPQRLGGDKNIMSALSPVQAADMAAEGRIQGEIWCGTASNDTSHEEESCSDFSEWIPQNHSSSSGAPDQNNKPNSAVISKRRYQNSKENLIPCSGSTNFVDLSLDHDEPRFGKRICRTEDSDNLQLTGTHVTLRSLDSAVRISSNDVVCNSEESAKWECETCTLLNPWLLSASEACNTLKPKDQSVKYKFWSCKFCTLENSVKLDNCSACLQWRYSTGAPMSTRAPGVGT